MAWARLDDHIYDNPKLLSVEPTDRLLYVWAICWCSRNGTDGLIDARFLRYIAIYAGVDDPGDAAQRLVDAGLWHPADDTDGWHIHDFDEYQPTAEKVEEVRAKRAEAGRKGGHRSGETRRSNGPTSSEANGEAKPKQTAKQTPQQTASKNEPRSRSPIDTFSSSSGPSHQELSTGDEEDDQIIDLVDPQDRSDEADPAASTDPAIQRAWAAAKLAGRADMRREARAGKKIKSAKGYSLGCAYGRWALDGDRLTEAAREHPKLELEALLAHVSAMAAHPGGNRTPAGGGIPALVGCDDCLHSVAHPPGSCPFADEPLTEAERSAIEAERRDRGDP